MSARYFDNLPCEPSCLIGGQENYHVSDVFRSADAPKRDYSLDLLLHFRRHPARLDRAGCYGVNRNPESPELNGHTAREGFQRRFARPVSDLRCKRLGRVCADVNNATERSLSRFQSAGKLGHQQDGCPSVHGKVSIKRARTDLERGIGRLAVCCIVDKYLDGSKSFFDALDKRFGRFFQAEIALSNESAATLLTYPIDDGLGGGSPLHCVLSLIGCCLTWVGAQEMDRHCSAFSGKGLSRGCTYAAIRTSDEDHPIL